MTTFIINLLGLKRFQKPRKEGFFGMSSSEKKQVFKKVIREANREQYEMVMRHPQKFKDLQRQSSK